MMSPAPIPMSPPSIAAAATGPVVPVPQHQYGFDQHVAHHHIPTAHMLSSLPKEMLAPAAAQQPAAASALRQGNSDQATIMQMHNSDSALLGNGRSFAAPISRGELLRRCAEMSMLGPTAPTAAATAPTVSAPVAAPFGVPLGGIVRSAATTNVSNVHIRPVMPPKQTSLKRMNPSVAEGVGGGFLKEHQQPRAQKRSKSTGSVALFASVAAAHSELREEFEDSSSSLNLQQPVKRDLPSLVGSSLSSLDSSSSGIIENEKPAQPPAKPVVAAEKPSVSPASPAQMIRELLKHDSTQDSTSTTRAQDDEDAAAHHDSFFTKPTPAQIADYTTEIVAAVRNRDISLLRTYLREGGKERLNCRNRFGESLLHAACRRGYDDVARFLLADAGVSVRAKDDYGRTPLHDACWTATPNFELMDVLLVRGGRDAAELLLAGDVRGHVPFDYARREHWDGWRGFVEERREMILSSYRGGTEEVGRVKEESG